MRLRLIPLLLLCLSGAAHAGSLPPLRVAPDLLRGGAAEPATPPAASPRSQVTPVVSPEPIVTIDDDAPEADAEGAAPSRTGPQPTPEPEPLAPATDTPDTSAARTPTTDTPEAETAARRPTQEREDPVETKAEAGAEAEAAREHQAPAPAAPVGGGTGIRPAPAASTRASTVPGSAQPPSPATGRSPAVVSTDVVARNVFGLRGVEMIADGDAELHREDTVFYADRMTFNELTDEVTAEGNLRYERGEDWVTGERGRFIVYLDEGEVEEPYYFLSSVPVRDEEEDEALGIEQRAPVSGRGQADVMHFEGENQYRMTNATWTTCEPETDDWHIRAADLQLDFDREVGTARGSTLVFKDLPILWWPRMTFPLAQQRQSGFLTPTVGMSTRTGLDISAPYYFNIAPNYDATIAPRIMGRRGMQLAGEYRYLARNYEGEAQVEYMPRDRLTGNDRALGSLRHDQRLAPGLRGRLNLNAVSDDEYFEDLSSVLAVTSRRNLLRDARLDYTAGGWWRAGARFQSYQTLEGNAPYRRLPQLTLEADRADLPLGTALAFESEYVSFSNPDSFRRNNGTFSRPDGKRLHMYPQLSLPHVRAGYYITPKIGLHYTRYDIEGPAVAGGRESITRSLPIFSVDSGMFFDREARFFGNDYEQTLEPRLYYVHIPHRFQGDIPRFDTARYDFGLAQIFSENRFSGIDRVGDANQVTLAVTSRLIEPESGAERLRFTLGQRYHFEDRRVSLLERSRSEAEGAETDSRTDLLAAFSGYLTENLSLDAATQYSPSRSEAERFNVAMRYQPDHLKALNVGYRFARESEQRDMELRDIDVSAQWPMGGRWYGVGRVTRSIKEDRTTEALAGVEYLSRCGCWALRVAAHRFALEEDRSSSSLFFQLELTGVGGLGPSPVNLLKRSVPGYGMITESVSDRYFGYE